MWTKSVNQFHKRVNISAIVYWERWSVKRRTQFGNNKSSVSNSYYCPSLMRANINDAEIVIETLSHHDLVWHSLDNVPHYVRELKWAHRKGWIRTRNHSATQVGCLLNSRWDIFGVQHVFRRSLTSFKRAKCSSFSRCPLIKPFSFERYDWSPSHCRSGTYLSSSTFLPSMREWPPFDGRFECFRSERLLTPPVHVAFRSRKI